MLTNTQFRCMTNATRKSLGLPEVPLNDRSIHPLGKYSTKNTKAPERQREGLIMGNKTPHKSNPYGGKKLRKARERLRQRIEGQQPHHKQPDRIRDSGNMTPWGNYGFTKAGSMKA